MYLNVAFHSRELRNRQRFCPTEVPRGTRLKSGEVTNIIVNHSTIIIIIIIISSSIIIIITTTYFNRINVIIIITIIIMPYLSDPGKPGVR